MITWATLLMCVAISADAFVVSLGKGLALKKIDKRAVLTVSIWFDAFHAIMPLIGWLAGTTFHEFIDIYDNWVMFLVMLILGLCSSGKASKMMRVMANCRRTSRSGPCSLWR